MKFAAKLFLLYEKSVQHKKACEAGTKENKTKGFFKEEKIMVVVLKPDTKEEQIENLKGALPAELTTDTEVFP